MDEAEREDEREGDGFDDDHGDDLVSLGALSLRAKLAGDFGVLDAFGDGVQRAGAGAVRGAVVIRV